jgi:hypothetical protein
MSLTSIDWNLIAWGISEFATSRAEATVSIDPVKGPDHASTGKGLTG